ncbi:zinc ribbon domain-containing protein [Phosphitispora fastidiosa]|uniref:zinc ribbon domain-containing protein n=1 Tax=Phosphitispora fastidiosa TaxID=2837202 RepID=UPI001E5866C2|nr:zinc ribbon domain-containing protein [Phosphitispora fastidiosa]MBU7006559.1 hypothetical protein [Phosphitispora fastidiosa]
MDKVREPMRFNIEQDDIGSILAGDTGLVPNSGSAFYKAAPSVESNRDLTALYGELLTDREFLRAMRIATQPDLYIVVRVAGAQGLTEIRLHRRKSEGESVVTTEQRAEGSLTLSVFENAGAWLNEWVKGFAGDSDAPAANYIPPKVSLEEFLFVLHAVDSFRRTSYQNMLSHVFTDRAYVKVPEFLQSMADSLKSMDVRWLLPAFLAVTPGVEQYQTDIDPQNIAVLLQHDFFTEGKLASGENVLVFGEAGQIMGVEFFRSWFTSCGMEINVAGPEGFKTAERLFITPTILGNHFTRLENTDKAKAMVNHQVYTMEQLTFKLDELLGRAFAKDADPDRVEPGAAPSPVPPSPSTAPAPPVRKFCANCGSKILAEAGFCGNCGTKLK